MSDKPVALQMADDLINAFSGQGLCACAAVELRRLHSELERKSDAIQRLWKERDELRALNAELVEALRSTGLFLHHVWCDVQMNDYSFEKLNQQMQVVDAALAKWEAST